MNVVYLDNIKINRYGYTGIIKPIKNNKQLFSKFLLEEKEPMGNVRIYFENKEDLNQKEINFLVNFLQKVISFIESYTYKNERFDKISLTIYAKKIESGQLEFALTLYNTKISEYPARYIRSDLLTKKQREFLEIGSEVNYKLAKNFLIGRESC
jgi:hypothetical protein